MSTICKGGELVVLGVSIVEEPMKDQCSSKINKIMVGFTSDSLYDHSVFLNVSFICLELIYDIRII